MRGNALRRRESRGGVASCRSIGARHARYVTHSPVCRHSGRQSSWSSSGEYERSRSRACISLHHAKKRETHVEKRPRNSHRANEKRIRSSECLGRADESDAPAPDEQEPGEYDHGSPGSWRTSGHVQRTLDDHSAPHSSEDDPV